MKKWLNDLYAELLKYGFNPSTGPGPGPGPGPTPEPEPYTNIYQGKYLGDTYTDEQKQAIANGTFDGLNIGDYWTINGINWRIADVDYYYNVGDTAFTKHHVIIVPDTTLYDAPMNDEETVAGCYTGSKMYTTYLNNARTEFDNAFGSTFIPSHRGLYSNKVSNNVPDDWKWRDMRIELMSEDQVYGHVAWGVANYNGYDVGTQKTQFQLFKNDHTKINIRQNYWLTNVVGKWVDFAMVDAYGNANHFETYESKGVRPFACVIGDPD